MSLIATQHNKHNFNTYTAVSKHLRVDHETWDTAKAAINIPEQDTLGVQTAVSLKTTVVVLPNATNPIIVVTLLSGREKMRLWSFYEPNTMPYDVRSRNVAHNSRTLA